MYHTSLLPPTLFPPYATVVVIYFLDACLLISHRRSFVKFTVFAEVKHTQRERGYKELSIHFSS